MENRWRFTPTWTWLQGISRFARNNLSGSNIPADSIKRLHGFGHHKTVLLISMSFGVY
jgi:hypothetical protein